TYYFNDVETVLGQYLYVSSGDYVAYGVDGNGCISEEVSVLVSSPDELILEALVSDVLCYGGNTGEVELNGLGGEGEYSYSFNGSEFSANSEYIDLTAGGYDAALMDSNGCSVDMLVSVFEPEELL
ncbi:MAG: SprB repeat-containing protein, partial [Flavobacteriales bacterium]